VKGEDIRMLRREKLRLRLMCVGAGSRALLKGTADSI
jgi:hypothetical protein